MDFLLFEIKDGNDKVYQARVEKITSGILTINDELMLKIMSENNIDEIKYFSIKPNIKDIILSIKDYSLTDTIYIESFFDAKSEFSIFQSIGTNIHMVGQKIEHMQVDCASVFLAECSIEKMEVGIFSVVNQYQDLGGDKENIAYKMDKLELRDVNIDILDLYAESKNIIIQRSRINEFNNNGNMLKNITSTVCWLNIWQNTHIGKLSIGNRIEKMKIEDTSIIMVS